MSSLLCLCVCVKQTQALRTYVHKTSTKAVDCQLRTVSLFCLVSARGFILASQHFTHINSHIYIYLYKSGGRGDIHVQLPPISLSLSSIFKLFRLLQLCSLCDVTYKIGEFIVAAVAREVSLPSAVLLCGGCQQKRRKLTT